VYGKWERKLKVQFVEPHGTHTHTHTHTHQHRDADADAGGDTVDDGTLLYVLYLVYSTTTTMAAGSDAAMSFG